jgi:hypothetical protein
MLSSIDISKRNSKGATMAKQVISPEEFINKVNDRLPGCIGYKDGLRVFLVPEGASGKDASGYNWTFRDDLDAIGAVAMAANLVEKEFDVDPNISRA